MDDGLFFVPRARSFARPRRPGNSRAPAAIAQCALDMPSLEAQLQDLVGQLTPHQDELIAHQVAWKAVKELVNGHWPDVKVHLFGEWCIAGMGMVHWCIIRSAMKDPVEADVPAVVARSVGNMYWLTVQRFGGCRTKPRTVY